MGCLFSNCKAADDLTSPIDSADIVIRHDRRGNYEPPGFVEFTPPTRMPQQQQAHRVVECYTCKTARHEADFFTLQTTRGDYWVCRRACATPIIRRRDCRQCGVLPPRRGLTQWM